MTRLLGLVAPHPPIMVPQVGGSRSAVTADSSGSLDRLARMLSERRPDALVVVSPHAGGYADAFVVDDRAERRGDLASFGAPGAVHACPGDPALAAAIVRECDLAGIPAVLTSDDPAHRHAALDHGATVPLLFLDPDGALPVVECAFTMLPAEVHRAFGAAVRRAAIALGRDVVLVASGDLSHRVTPDAPAGYDPAGAVFDARVRELLSAGDFDAVASIDARMRDAAGECGWRSILILGGFLESAGFGSQVLSYEAPWGVGYLTAAFTGAWRDPDAGSKGGMPGSAESPPVALARDTVRRWVRAHGTPEAVPFDDPSLPARAGAFVTLHRGGELRGCIGTIAPTRPTLAEEIVGNAVAASSSDPRFPPVGPDELDDLEIHVDVLHAPEPVTDLGDLDPRVFGVIVSAGRRRGLLLPDLDGVDTVEQQLDIARRKGGIGADEPVSLERFRVDRYA